MELAFGHPKSLKPLQTKYCPGCGHGVIHRLIAEVIDEMGLQTKSIITNPVGCSIWADLYFDFDSVQPAHGRTPAASTAVKRMLPDHLVICYQGDGDLAAIGTAEIIHAANRGEKFTTIFVNNAIYGMTGGQMAPTTLIGQIATTAPKGRDPKVNGYPIKVCEMLAQLEGARYLERVAINTAPNVLKAKKAVLKAVKNQAEGKGFSLVEVLSTCPTNWGVSPVEAMKFVSDKMMPYYPLGVFRDGGLK